MDNVYARTARRLRELRTRRGMTQAALAERAGITSSFLSFLELGRKKGSLDTYDQLARGLGVRLADLFRDGTEEPAAGRGRYVIPVGHLTVGERQSLNRLAVEFGRRKDGRRADR